VREGRDLSSLRGAISLGLCFVAAAVTCAVPTVSYAAEPASPDAETAARMERWRAARAGTLKLPLPGTPDTGRLMSRLFAEGIALGAPMLIRVFKAEATLEVWLKKGGVYVPFAVYPVCYFSGGLGPKLREGDRQAPEGFYAIDEELLHHGGRWRRSLNIGYPNAYDRVNGRSGSAILVHGGCDSSGCFAMTNAVNAELYDLVAAALRHQRYVPVHVFPFRMTDAAMAARPASAWSAFWADLKLGYDSFERTRLPPHVSVCGKRYRVRDAMRGGEDAGAIEVCAEDFELVPAHLVTDRARAPATAQSQALARSAAVAPKPKPARSCSTARASCRRFVALRERAHRRGHVARAGRIARIR
jgi:murein L,D-transpeptidase YafK